MIHGDDIIVTTNIGGTQQPIAACKSGVLQLSHDFIKSCPPDQGTTFNKIPTTYDWSVSCNCLMSTCEYAKLILDAFRNGTELRLQFIVMGWKVAGSVFVRSCDITATKNSLAKMSVSFEGSGPLVDDISWDFINGTLYTYSNFAEGTLNMGGYLTDGTLQHEEPSES